MKVNDDIRRTVRKAIAELPISQAEVARKLGVKPQILNRALLHQGKVPEVWEGLFKLLGYELTLVKIPDADQS